MKEDGPAYRHYAKDWLEGTAHMSLEEQGAYQRLLDHQWERGVLPSEIVKLARLIGVSPVKAKRLWSVLAIHFPSDPPTNGRLEEERVKARRFREQRAEAGRHNGRSTTVQRPLNDRLNGRGNENQARAGASVSLSVAVPETTASSSSGRESVSSDAVAQLSTFAELESLIPSNYRDALNGALRSARVPSAVAAAIRGIGPGGIHQIKGVTWDIVGRALNDCLAGDGYGQRRLEVFVADLVRRGKESPDHPTESNPTLHPSREYLRLADEREAQERAENEAA